MEETTQAYDEDSVAISIGVIDDLLKRMELNRSALRQELGGLVVRLTPYRARTTDGVPVNSSPLVSESTQNKSPLRMELEKVNRELEELIMMVANVNNEIEV